MEIKLLLCTILCRISLSSTALYNTNKNLIGVGKPTDSHNTLRLVFEDKWFVQKLDHFNPTDTRRWKQRYHVNTNYYQKGGPVFLMVRGEEEITSEWMSNGAWIEYAKKFNALCFQIEHRYYGKSRPTSNTKVKNLVYLNSHQALADLADFISSSYIRTIYNISLSTKWVSFGGSYSGSLSAWLRTKYSHLVHTSVSSSAPLMAKHDFSEYYDVIKNELYAYKPNCVKQIKNATNTMEEIFKRDVNGDNVMEIQNKFKLCGPINPKDEKNVENLFASLATNFASVTQYASLKKYSTKNEYTSVTMKTLCDIMVNATSKAVDKYAAVNRKLLSLSHQKCLVHQYSGIVNYHSKTSWTDDASLSGNRQWMYQTCTEFGFYQTSQGKEHIFGRYSLNLYNSMCSDIFGKLFNSTLVAESIKKTNNLNGELKIKQTRIIFVHGSKDPWHVLGITHTKLKHSKAIWIKGTSHCADMYASSPTDSKELKDARKKIEMFLWQSLKEND